MVAAVWCKDHCPTKTIVHRMHDIVDKNGLNALQLYVRYFKQADLALTGTVRKATLVNQSTKLATSSASSAIPNRRASTTVVASTGRGSVSNIKTEEIPSTSPAELLRNPTISQSLANVCDTCGIDASPKWWPYAQRWNGGSASSTRHHFEPRVSNNQTDHPAKDLENTVTNENTQQSNPKQQVALAAAALSEDSPDTIREIEVQCHKCHWNKVQKPPTSPLIRASNMQHDITHPHQPPSVPVSVPPALASPLIPPTHMHSGSHYPWSHSTFSPSTTYGDWSRMSPASQNANLSLRQYNGSHSPRGPQTTGQHLSNQSQPRQPAPVIPRSPHMNGSLPPVTTSSYPSSPHLTLGGIHSMQRGAFVSYASSPPQHLANGGPPPRAPENPFSHVSHAPFRPTFGGSHGSPPIHHDSFQKVRESTNQNGSIARPGPSDHRVNGGASASPSLQNLLS